LEHGGETVDHLLTVFYPICNRYELRPARGNASPLEDNCRFTNTIKLRSLIPFLTVTTDAKDLKVIHFCRPAARERVYVVNPQFLGRSANWIGTPLTVSQNQRIKKKASLAIKNLSLDLDMVTDLFMVPAVGLILSDYFQSHRAYLRLVGSVFYRVKRSKYDL